MDKNILSKLLNDNKRFEVVKKDSRKTLKVVLKAFNDKKIVSETSSLVDGLNRNTTIIFKPVKAFTKKQLKGLDKYDLAEQQIEAEEEQRKRKDVGTHTLSNCNKEVQLKNTKEVFSKEDGFVNWFDLSPQTDTNELKKAKVISIKKADGSIVPLTTIEELDDELDGNY